MNRSFARTALGPTRKGTSKIGVAQCQCCLSRDAGPREKLNSSSFRPPPPRIYPWLMVGLDHNFAETIVRSSRNPHARGVLAPGTGSNHRHTDFRSAGQWSSLTRLSLSCGRRDCALAPLLGAPLGPLPMRSVAANRQRPTARTRGCRTPDDVGGSGRPCRPA